MKKISLIVIVLFITTSVAEADSYERFVNRFNYAVRTKDYKDACHYSRILEGELKDIGAEISMLDTINKLEVGLKEQKDRTSYYCNLAESEGTVFLLKNAKKATIVTTASGLQYEILIAGAGNVHPSETDSVTVHYKGTTLDGKEFDSSYSRGEPTSFPLNRVIVGWTEGLQLMTVGAKYRFYIPSDLAYGSQGAGPIAPNATLIFDVELLKIK